jgi:hypothetical protein
VERVIGTLRRECLDHLIVLDEQHLTSVLAEFLRYLRYVYKPAAPGFQRGAAAVATA